MINVAKKDIIRKIINNIIMELMEDNKENKKLSSDLGEAILLTETDDDKSIFDFGIDSLAYIRLVIYLEDFFNIEFGDEDLLENKLLSLTDFFMRINEILQTK